MMHPPADAGDNASAGRPRPSAMIEHASVSQVHANAGAVASRFMDAVSVIEDWMMLVQVNTQAFSTVMSRSIPVAVTRSGSAGRRESSRSWRQRFVSPAARLCGPAGPLIE